MGRFKVVVFFYQQTTGGLWAQASFMRGIFAELKKSKFSFRLFHFFCPLTYIFSITSLSINSLSMIDSEFTKVTKEMARMQIVGEGKIKP